MIRTVEVKEGPTLKDYAAYASLLPTVTEFRTEAELGVSQLKPVKIVMVNSTDKGGGVAEMLPSIIRISREFNLKIEWVVIGTDNQDFYALTKNIHNLIHGSGDTKLTEEDRQLFEEVNRENAEELIPMLNPGDLLVIHDPQPMAMAKYIKEKVDVKAIWRSHIGLDFKNKQTKAAWTFLKPYAEFYDHYVFTSPEYIPAFIMGNVSIIAPGLDPLSHKNRDLPIHKLSGILRNAGLIHDGHPVLTEPFVKQVQRVQLDGSFGSAKQPSEIGLLFRPIITEISRWDRLKGFLPLMQGFVEIKKDLDKYGASYPIHRNRLESVRLILAGPDPEFVKDDPEGLGVLKELTDFYTTLPPEIAEDIAILLLPMESTKENALIVNALQRCSSIVVQNSIQEGFGLTATEAMWKIRSVMGTHACGLRHQIRNGMDGKLINDPEDPLEIADMLDHMLENPKKREIWAYTAQKNVIDNFLIFSQLGQWLNVIIPLCQK